MIIHNSSTYWPMNLVVLTLPRLGFLNPRVLHLTYLGGNQLASVYHCLCLFYRIYFYFSQVQHIYLSYLHVVIDMCCGKYWL